MNRAKHYTDLIEGFKLGSLGVSRKPTEIKVVEPIDTREREIEGFQVTSTIMPEWEWSETIVDPDWISLLHIHKTLDSIKNVYAYIILHLSIQTPTNTHLRCSMYIYDTNKSQRAPLAEGRFEFPLKLNWEEAVSWLNKEEDKVRKRGISSILRFPQGWKKGWSNA